MLDAVPEMRRIKIDRLFVERRSAYILALLRDRGLEVFYDAKYIEVPSKLEELAKVGVEHEPWMLDCMAGSTSNGDMTMYEERDLIDGLRRFADVCLNAQVLPCGVTVLTSKTDEIIAGEFNGRSAIDQVLWYAEKLVMAGFTDVVCSPMEAQAIYQRFSTALNANTPAIRFADGDAGDQARVMTPAKAIENKAERLVMGRPLMGGDPAALFARAVAEVEAATAA